MASPRSDLLAAEHKRQQIQTAAKAQARITSAWRQEMADTNIAVAAHRWLELAVPILQAARKSSARTAAGYYLANRMLEVPDAPRIVLPPTPDIDVAQLKTSLWVTGPLEVISKDYDPLDKITQIEGAVKRHTLNGGRDQIEAVRDVDKLLVGYYRETDGDPCYFCAMLASRGVVYSEESFDSSDPRFTGPGNAKVHDTCGCFNRPWYDKAVTHPGQTKDFLEAWKNRDQARPGESEVNAFRRSYELTRAPSATLV